MTEAPSPRPAGGSGGLGSRPDQMLAVLLDRQVDALLAGIGVAAFQDEQALESGKRCPSWLVEDLEITMRLTRLAYAAGLDVPDSLYMVTAASEHHSAAHAHLIGGRSRYQAIADVLGRLITHGDIPDSLRPDADCLLRDACDQQARAHH